MKKLRFTESQIMAILKQHKVGTSVPDLAREHSISSASIYQWRAKYGGMDVSMMKRKTHVLSCYLFSLANRLKILISSVLIEP